MQGGHFCHRRVPGSDLPSQQPGLSAIKRVGSPPIVKPIICDNTLQCTSAMVTSLPDNPGCRLCIKQVGSSPIVKRTTAKASSSYTSAMVTPFLRRKPSPTHLDDYPDPTSPGVRTSSVMPMTLEYSLLPHFRASLRGPRTPRTVKDPLSRFVHHPAIGPLPPKHPTATRGVLH